MKVIKHIPHRCNLPLQRDTFYLDVLCWHGPRNGMEGFSTRIQLNEAEEILYAESGFKFINDFAKTIQLDFKDISNRDIQDKDLISSIRLAI